MKDQDQNLAVAKFHGWEEIRHNPKTDLRYGKPPQDAAHPWDVVIPDYGKDLNAMHRVEMMLTDIQWSIYRIDLTSVCERDDRIKYGYTRTHQSFWHSSASQRREALLRCLNLWVEE